VEAANAASAAKDWPRAAALWDELRAARPHDAHRWFAAGHAYSEARMLEQAERILGEAVTGVLARLGRQEESEQLLREAASRFPDEYWPNHAAARLQADRSDPQGALRTWYALAERFPDQPSATAALKTAVAAAERS